MAYWAAATMVAGGALKTYGQYRNLLAEIHLKKYQGQIAGNNALLANMEGDLKETQGQTDLLRYRLGVSRLLSSQKVGFAASGLDISQGTPAEVMAATAQVGESEAQTIKFNTLLDVWRLRTQAQSFEAEKELLDSQAKDAKRNIWPTILGGALGAAGQGMYSIRRERINANYNT